MARNRVEKCPARAATISTRGWPSTPVLGKMDQTGKGGRVHDVLTDRHQLACDLNRSHGKRRPGWVSRARATISLAAPYHRSGTVSASEDGSRPRLRAARAAHDVAGALRSRCA